MDIDTLRRTKDLAVKAGHAMFNKLDHGNRFPLSVFHMNDVCRAYRITEPATCALFHIDIDDHIFLEIS